MQDKYLTYSSIALAGEESFVQMVRQRENESLWNRWIDAHPEYQASFDEAKRIVHTMDMMSPAIISETDKRALWKSISLKTKADVRAKPKTRIKGLWTWGMAAAASLALLFWLGSDAGTNKVYAEIGEHKEVILPEQSIVSINAGSRIIYKEKSFDTDRVLHLEGEAFFNVEPGSTFKVLTDEGTITVVGTSFNVVARDGQFEVSCYTGKVLVERGQQNKVELTIGQETMVDKPETNLLQSDFDASKGKPEWINGVFRFENQPLSEVIEELERQYDVDVVLSEELGELNYIGLFESGDLAEALQLITWPLHLESSIKGKTITITR